jgi:hypothetical protein
MVSEKAIYWMAVGVMGVSLGNHFVSRYDGRCLAQRSLAAAQRLSGEASHFMAMAGVTIGRAGLPLERSESELARIQTRLATVDTVMARQQAVCARLQARRVMALQPIEQIQLLDVCPRRPLQLSVPRPVASPRDGTI